MNDSVPRLNNFDLLRLLAAVQVFVMHSIAWLKVPAPIWFLEVADWFPGVPIFFMISGCLVADSFSKSRSLVNYFWKRALRIFPGLWVCLGVSYILVAVRGELDSVSLIPKTLVWLAMQGSILQFVNFYVNPGVTNGVLWSVSTELQFYILLPAFFVLIKRVLDGRVLIGCIVVLAFLSGLFHQWVLEHQLELLPRLFPTLYASILANAYCFLFGLIFYLWRNKLLMLVSGRWAFCLVAYLALRMSLTMLGVTAGVVHSTVLAVIVYALLAGVVFSTAFSFVTVAKSTLKGNDFSFGIYLYHMPLLYLVLYFGETGVQGMAMLFALLCVFAAGSWYFVERPFLRIKSRLQAS